MKNNSVDFLGNLVFTDFCVLLCNICFKYAILRSYIEWHI